MKKWKHDIVATPGGVVRVVPYADYKKIMAVYRAAAKVSSLPSDELYDSDAIDKLDKAIYRAEA